MGMDEWPKYDIDTLASCGRIVGGCRSVKRRCVMEVLTSINSWNTTVDASWVFEEPQTIM